MPKVKINAFEPELGIVPADPDDPEGFSVPEFMTARLNLARARVDTAELQILAFIVENNPGDNPALADVERYLKEVGEDA